MAMKRHLHLQKKIVQSVLYPNLMNVVDKERFLPELSCQRASGTTFIIQIRVF